MNIKKALKRILVVIYSIIKRDYSSKVIYYHDISHKYTDQGTSLTLFTRHLNIIKREGYSVVSDIPKRDKEVMICFDDGWRGIWDFRQFFVDNGIYPTVFLIVNFIGKKGYLTRDEILELQDLGFRFQGHTYNHKNVTELKGSELDYEMIDSRNVLNKLLGKEVDEFCFPKGKYSEECVEKALNNGYRRVYISTPGNIKYQDRIIKRNLVQQSSPMEFKAILKGGLGILAKHAENLHHV